MFSHLRVILAFFILLILGLGGFLAYAYATQSYFFAPKVVHYHAGFQVYVDGSLHSFSNFRYMDITPCTAKGLASEDPQEVKAHLHEGVGDVVHVHRTGVIWKDLFINLHFQPVLTGPVEGYINGKKIENILVYPIKPYDVAIFFIGKHDAIATYMPHAVTIGHIKQIEKTSELCGTSGG